MASLASTPLPRLLLDLHRERFSGWLTLERGSVTRRLQWAEGSPVRLESSVERDGLVARLHERGLRNRKLLILLKAKIEVPEEQAPTNAELGRDQ